MVWFDVTYGDKSWYKDVDNFNIKETKVYLNDETWVKIGDFYGILIMNNGGFGV